MTLTLSEIDRRKTKKAVVQALNYYRTCLFTLNQKELPKVTQSFKLTVRSQTNQFYSSTEKTAIENVDRELEKRAYMEMIQEGVNRLPDQEREVIVRCYIQEQEELDYQIYNSMLISERQFYRIKAKAILTLGLILHLQVKRSESSLDA